jgi:flagellar basal-body rod protein FlgF/flagellar basal-body rod protein FlgG
MDSGYYAACTALVTRMQALDTIANNLANASTTGYRSEQNMFSAILTGARGASGTALNQAINSYGILGGSTLDFSEGSLQSTGNDLDMAVEGKGFFVVQTANGPMYTRDGSFQTATNGQLVTAAGDAVLGDRGVLNLPPGPISIAADGTISSNNAVVGRLKIVEFPPATQITSAGGTYYSAPANTAVAATASTVRQGVLESSNVNPIQGMVELITAQRSAETMQRALSMFNSEMDKTATQDLPKISQGA